MKKSIVFAVLSVLASHLFAQQFAPAFTLPLPDSIKSSKAEWIDIDNDGVLDILLMATNDDNEQYLMFVKGDTVASAVLRPQTFRTIDIDAYVVVDYDRDNTMDLVASGMKAGSPITVVYQNLGNYSFAEMTLDIPQFTTSIFADLDNDAQREWIMSGGSNINGYLSIYSQDSDGDWAKLHPDMQMKLNTVEIIDGDSDGKHDLFVSGRVSADSVYTGLLINQDSVFVPRSGKEWIGTTSSADLNEDGRFDVVFLGIDELGARISKVFTSGPAYTIAEGSISLLEPRIFLADLNSDGIVDRSFFGKNADGDTLHVIRYDVEVFDTLDTKKVSFYTFGDREHDGDLDVLQIVGTTTLEVRLLKNNTVRNVAPTSPPETVAISVFDRLFLYWEKSNDDHTPVTSLTYDLYFNLNGVDRLAADFDLINEKRLVTSHGNNGTFNFKLLQNTPSDAFSYMVQSVDNSFHAKRLCTGGVGGCVLAQPEIIFACNEEEVQLSGSPNTLWFSFSEGFLGQKASLGFNPAETDTVFSFTPVQGIGCDKMSTYIIQIRDEVKEEPAVTRYVCEGATINLSVESTWTSIAWSSTLKGSLGSSATISYKFQQPDSIFVIVGSDDGCSIKRTTVLKLSKPVVTVDAEKFKILKGTQVQLHAAGAERYEWKPTSSLSDAAIASPIATPLETTQYIVTGYDSLGCSGTADVTIFVEGTGFIPNLFTPTETGPTTNFVSTGFLQLPTSHLVSSIAKVVLCSARVM